MDKLLEEKLVSAAAAAREHAYAPYSKFAVGAAILCESGEMIAGANVENASYGLTLCAERVAASTAVARGERKFTAIAVVTSGGATPCGACRQFLAEFGNELEVLLVDADELTSVRKNSLEKLLPEQFRL